jgi:tRNA nucleotidyltransferase (CCA-adding enzyme)
MMARRAHVYPQVQPRAVDLVDGVVVSVPRATSVAEALRAARRRDAAAVACGDAHALRDDLGRAETLGLGALPACDVARPLPVVDGDTPELPVRRLLEAGARAVVVVSGRACAGLVARAPLPRSLSMTARFTHALDPEALARLASIGHLAAAQGARAWLVGGVVRDAWLGRRADVRDLDIVVEGDALAVARAVSAEVRGGIVEHARFLTASVDAPGGGRIDVVTARSERYEAPGALPRVMPATIAQDLRRRDFTVNALAVELASGTFGLLDPLGGAADLARRRLTILHPLSFVEDPTRMFRAARYGARLDFRPDAWTLSCQALALRLAPYPALSGQRVVAELDLIARDARPDRALTRLGQAGVLRLLDARYHFTRATARRLTALPAALAWSATLDRRAAPVELVTLTLLGDQPRDVVEAGLRRLAIVGDPLLRTLAALDDAGPLAARLARATRASETAAALRGRDPLALAWLWLTVDAAARQRLDAGLTRAGDGAPLLRGADVIELGVPRGPAVARALAALRDGRLDGEISDRAAEIDYVRRWIARQREE